MTTSSFGRHQQENVSSNIRGLKQTFNTLEQYYIVARFVFDR
uniref:Uncharacterized protein n=1 Tax=Rhizobium leguminosarum bv. viciae TaxID=387 RepID=A0A0U3J6L0_RHILV|nr:hypothetical protein [Rhizobium leguminosarum bv. viciae]